MELERALTMKGQALDDQGSKHCDGYNARRIPLTNEASVSENESRTNPHTFTKRPEPTTDYDEVIGGRIIRAIDSSKADSLHLRIDSTSRRKVQCRNAHPSQACENKANFRSRL